MFRGMGKSTKLGAVGTAGWTWENYVECEMINLSGMVPNGATNQRGLAISDDGHSLYVGFISGNTIRQYYLSIAGDLTTITTSYKDLVIGTTDNIETFSFGDEGRKLYFCTYDSGNDSENRKIRQYTLSTPWDISSAGSLISIVGPSISHYYAGIDVAPDGSSLFVGIYGYTMYSISMPTPFDISGGAVIATSADVPNTISAQFAPDGMRVIANIGYQYDFAAPWDIESAVIPDPLSPYAMPRNFGHPMNVSRDGKNAFCGGFNTLEVTRMELASGGTYTPAPVPTGITARYWGIKNTDTGAVKLTEFELLLNNNALAVTECDPASYVAGLGSYGDKTDSRITDCNFTNTFSAYPLDTVLKYDLGFAENCQFLRVGSSVAPYMAKCAIMYSLDDTTWFISNNITMTQTSDARFCNENYIDITSLIWTEV